MRRLRRMRVSCNGSHVKAVVVNYRVDAGDIPIHLIRFELPQQPVV